nr:MAG TPA: secretion system protein [Caudoviricetes sp.]
MLGGECYIIRVGNPDKTITIKRTLDIRCSIS